MSSNGEARGLKRQADDTLDDEQRFAKRFNLLNLDHNGKLYIPVSAHSATQPILAPSSSQAPPPPSRGQNTSDEYMQLDDTKHRVYIHNLDEELADIDSNSSSEDDEKLIFLPDIEKKLGKIPKHLLTEGNSSSSSSSSNNFGKPQGRQELVLYSVPSSLTVPEERDSVRKAILEARHRAQEAAVRDTERLAARKKVPYGGAVGDDVDTETAHGYGVEEYAEEEVEDPDAMDIG